VCNIFTTFSHKEYTHPGAAIDIASLQSQTDAVFALHIFQVIITPRVAQKYKSIEKSREQYVEIQSLFA
jgi:hypothetical protein